MGQTETVMHFPKCHMKVLIVNYNQHRRRDGIKKYFSRNYATVVIAMDTRSIGT